MATITPASNVQIAAIAAFLSAIIEHVCSANGIVIPADVGDSLPAIVAILVAHGCDMMTGGNKPPASS